MSAALVATVAATSVWMLTPTSSAPRLWEAVDGISGVNGVSGLGGEAVAVGCVAAVVAMAVGPTLAIAVCGLVLAGSWWRRRHAHTVSCGRVHDALPGICDHLARLLTAGATPNEALRSAADSAPRAVGAILRESAAAGELGGSRAASLARAGPLQQSLSAIAASWAAADAAGAPLAPVLRGVGAAMLADREHARVVDTELAGPRLTGWLLAALPVFGLGVAASLGTSSVSVLLGTPLGLTCLLGAATLDVCGLLWLRALARRPA